MKNDLYNPFEIISSRIVIKMGKKWENNAVVDAYLRFEEWLNNFSISVI